MLSLVVLALTAHMAVNLALPAPRRDSASSVERALGERRSVRDYAPAPIDLAQLSQLLWSAQGVTDSAGRRTARSAGALYPLEVFVISGEVNTLAPGVYHYQSHGQNLARVRDGDMRADLADAALGQRWIERAPAALVFTAIEARAGGKYGRRAARYIAIEVGHAAQNVALQAVCLGLATGMVGAFDDDAIDRLLALPAGQHALYIVPVGHSAS